MGADYDMETLLEMSKKKKPYLSMGNVPERLEKSPYRWVMLALLWLLYVSFGLVFRSMAPLVTPMLKDLQMTYGEMGFVLGSWQLTYLVFAILAGIMMDKWGVRNALFLGISIIGLSAGLRYFVCGFTTLLLVTALFGVGGPLISTGCPKVTAQWFMGKERGLAVGIYMTAPSIGGILALTATNSLVMPLAGYSWRLTFVYYAVFTFIIAFLWRLFARDAPNGETGEKAGVVEVFSKLIKIPNVRIILSGGLLSFAVLHGYTNWLPKILEVSGMSPSSAGFASALPLLAEIPSILVLPSLIPVRFRGRAIGLLALLAASSMLLLSNAIGASLFVGLILLGVSGFAMAPLLIISLMEIPEVGPRYMGSAGGIFFCISDFGGFIGPSIMGAFADWSGTFLPGTLFQSMLCLLIFIITFRLKPSLPPGMQT